MTMNINTNSKNKIKMKLNSKLNKEKNFLNTLNVLLRNTP